MSSQTSDEALPIAVYHCKDLSEMEASLKVGLGL